MQTTKVFDVFKQISFCGRYFYCFLFCFVFHTQGSWFIFYIINIDQKSYFLTFYTYLIFAFVFFVSYNWDVNVTECKWLWSVRFTAQLQHTYWCILPILPDNHESTNKCSTDSQSLLCTAQCDLIWRGKLFIFLFFLSSWKSCFYLLLIFTQVAWLCRNGIASCSFHICINGRPCVITWIFFLQIQCSNPI